MKSENSAETQQFDAAELGAIMREMRENLGHDLASVASDLRIRPVYLEAIESGRLADLPGSAYVSGFLRAYSDFLGLDGEEIARRFRMAGVDISNQTQLHLPSPVEEGHLPTGPILLLAAIVAAVAYGGWYYFSTPDSNPVDRIASLPAELSRMVEADSDSSSSDAPASPAAASPRETADATAPAAEAAATAPQAAPESSTPAPMASETRSADGAATDASPAAESASAAPAPTGASASPGAKRIVVRATADSFVAVLTSDDQPLFSQLMRAGDIYEVPSGAGLILETGNAGALEIRVDGRHIPSLGLVGEIRRNIPLDAEKLLAGIN